MKKNCYILFCAVIANMFLFLSCSNKEKVQETLAEYLNKVEADKEVAIIRNNLRDSLQSWIDKGLDYIQFFRKTEWKVDNAVLLNKNKDKGLFFVPLQPLDSLWSLDYVKIIAGEKIGISWKFYYASYLLMEFRRSDNNGLPFSVDLLVKEASSSLAEDGFINCNLSCRINYSYVDSDIWFADWRRKMHVTFLQNDMPTISVEDPRNVPH